MLPRLLDGRFGRDYYGGAGANPVHRQQDSGELNDHPRGE